MVTATLDQAGDMALARHCVTDAVKSNGAQKNQPKVSLANRARGNGAPHCNLRTVAQVLEHYLRLGMEDLAERSRENIQHTLDLFAAEDGRRHLADCRPLDLRAFLNRHLEFKSEWTKRRVVATIKRAFAWAEEMELIRRHPYRTFRLRGELPNRRQPMDPEHFQALLRSAPPAWRRFLTFLKWTGARPGEAAAMRWRDVKLEEPTVIIHRHKTARTGRPRSIPLTPPALKLLVWMRWRRQSTTIGLLVRLLRHGRMKGVQVARFMSHFGVSDRAVARARNTLGVIKRRVGGAGPSGYYTYELPPAHLETREPGENDPVFTSCLGNPLDRRSIACFMRRTRARAGLPAGVCLYQLRHAWFTRGVRNKTPLKLLSVAGGHASVRTTEIYIHEIGLGPEVQAAALQAVYGPGAYAVPKPRPIPTVTAPPAAAIAAVTEQLPDRWGTPRPRPHVPAGLVDVPLPSPAADPTEQPLAVMVKNLMAIVARKPARPAKAPTSAEVLSPAHAAAWDAYLWAVKRKPELAHAKDREVFAWLTRRQECPHKLPATFATWQRYLGAARRHHGTRKCSRLG
jgi:integrase